VVVANSQVEVFQLVVELEVLPEEEAGVVADL
jgi:hypothetical protein